MEKDMESMRINRYLSHYGVCSRREADRRISAGRVHIDGRVASLGDTVRPGDAVTVDGKPIGAEPVPVILAYHKPVGVICTTSEKEHPNLTDVIDYPERVFAIGRLDRDSSGLILLTNDGVLADELMRGRHEHEKEYIVCTDKPLKESIRQALEQGVPLPERMTKPCRIFYGKEKGFHMILTQGMNRQIRRMCEYFGYRVVSLTRIRFVTVTIDDLPEGQWRLLTEEETECLRRAI